MNPAAEPTQTAARKHYRVSGMVVNSLTGEPLRRALIQAHGQEQHSTLSGPDGHFQLDSVPEGQVFISTQKPGYFERHGTYLAVGPTTPDVLLKLIPEAKIEGRVTDRDGEPIEGLQVQCVAEGIVSGRKRWQQRGGTSTNESGSYRFDNLAPGRYVIRTTPQAVFPLYANFISDSQYTPMVYPAQYFPGAPDYSSAQPLELKPGQEAEADFSIVPVRALRISGTVLNPWTNLAAICEDSNGEQVTATAVDPRSGRFIMRQIPAGSYTIIFRSSDAQGSAYYAEQAVDVSTANVDDLRVVLQPLASIPITVAGTSDSAARPQLQVHLIAKQKRQGGGEIYASQKPESTEGSLVLQSVPPGEYTVSAQIFGQQCIGSITSGSLDLLQNDLTVQQGSTPQPIEVTLREDCAALSGTVDPDATEAPGRMAILVPELESSEPKLAPVQPGGAFSFVGIAPGEYRAYAFSDIDNLEYANPEMMRDFAGQGVTLSSNQKAQINLKLNARGTN